MTEHLLKDIPSLTDKQLVTMLEDCQSRVSSNMSSGSYNEEYVLGQRKIIFTISDELEKRGILKVD